MPDNAVQSSDTVKSDPTTARRWRWRRWRWYTALGTLALAGLGLVCGELWVRAQAARDSYFNICLGAGDEWDPHRTFRLRSNFSIGGVRTNSKGILGPEFYTTKTPGSFRIVTLGDSCSFIPVERNYPTVLEDRLQRTGVDVEVINASCPGYRSDQLRDWYEREIDAYEHDLLVVYVGWNDMSNPQTQETAVIPPQPTLFQSLVRRSYLLRYTTYLQVRQSRGPVSLEPLHPEEMRTLQTSYYPVFYERNLLAIVNLAKARNRQVLLLNRATLLNASPTADEQRRMHFPAWMGRRLQVFLAFIQLHETAVQRVSQATGAPIVDIKSLFQTVEARRVFTDSTHFNAQGAEMIAARVAEAIVPYVAQADPKTGEAIAEPIQPAD